jgi:hypothetical protein
MARLSTERYAALYGPSLGDQLRLGDTDLWIEVEEDRTFGGEESVFGGGKSIRESMNQGTTTTAEGAPDTVITNVVVLDWWGIIRADVGIRAGRIVALGRAGNPDIADGVHTDLQIGPSTDVISGEGRILTAGAFDSHVHLLSPSQLHEALATGITTIAGGGTGPSEGSKATTVTPGAWHLGAMLRALDDIPMNILLLGKGNTVSAAGLAEQALGGAAGYKVHEDWGATPAAIDAALEAADDHGLQVALHSDSLNEAGFVESTISGDRGTQYSRLSRRRRRRWARSRHPIDRGAREHPPGIDEPDPAAHREYDRRAPRHAHGLSPSQPRSARRPRVRRVPHPGDDDCGRGPAPRHGRPVDHVLGRSGDGPHRRSHHPHLAGRPRDEASGGQPR